MILLELFCAFFKIGLFTFGGGYAMIPMIQQEVISHGWADMTALIDFIAVSESTPGPFAVNIATFIGNSQAGFAGALTATLGVTLPSFLVILLIAKFLSNFSENKYVKAMMSGLRPAVIGLLGGTVFSVIVAAVLLRADDGLVFDLCAAVIFGVVFGLSRIFKKIHPAAIVLVSAALGIVLYGFL